MLTGLSLSELGERFRRREVTPTEAAVAYLDRIDALDGEVRAFLTVTREHALAQAAAADARFRDGRPRGPLDGVPVALKDLFCTRGIRTTAGSRILERFVPPYDATVVARLAGAGAVVLGKLNMDEFAMGSSTEHSGFFTTRNPWDVDRVPGGSSGGASAAVAAGMAAASLGTDTGGSIRQPAAFCGTVGFKPTYGRVSRYGVIAFASSLDQVGPFARTVEDVALMLQVIAGADPMDSTAVATPVPDYAAELGRGIEGLRIGIPAEYFIEGMNPDVESAVRAAIATLERLGARTEPVSLPHTGYGLAAYYVIAPAEASSNLARYDGVKYGLREHGGKDLIDMYGKTRAAGFGDEVKRRLMLGTYALSAGYYEAYYGRAQKVRTLVRRDFQDAFERVNLIAAPTTPGVAFKLGEKADPLSMYLNDVLTIPVNLAGLPGISVPAGFTNGGLPIGLQLIGPAFDEATVLRAAHAYERATDWHTRRPSLGERPAVSETRYETVIGLEVHAQLATATKMFCGCATGFGAPPNTQTCPVCQGMPGSLPVINRRAIEFGVRTSLALGCAVNARNRFARKHYYYPDMPKNYQISQYEEPLAEHGVLAIASGDGARDIRVQRLHLEEDVGKLVHEGALATAAASQVDYNRAGVPLMEIVSHPDIRSPEEAAAYLRALRAILIYLGVCDGNMEEGSLRCDANVSLRPRGVAELGTKVEIKNLNSFRNVQHALEYEVVRQARALDAGERLTQETRLWDPDRARTVSMRSKEFAHDYRYFPEPDLPPLHVEARWIDEIRVGLPELPAARRARFELAYGLSAYDALLLTQGRGLADYFEEAARAHGKPKAVANWVLNELLRELPGDDDAAVAASPVPPDHLVGLLALIDDGSISGRIAKDVFEKMCRSGEAADAIVRREGLTQVADAGALGAVVDEVLAAHPKVVADLQAGKKAALGFLVGQVMKSTGGRANPAVVNALLGEKLPKS